MRQKPNNIWDGNYFSLDVTLRLGLEVSGGMVRVGPVHYNQAPRFWVRSLRILVNAGEDQAVLGGVGEDSSRYYITVKTS